MFKKIDHVEIVPRDLERSIKFYTKILGFKVKLRRNVGKPPLEEVVFLELNGTCIELFSVQNPAPPSTEQWQLGCRKIALEVEDIDKAVEYLKTKGVKISLDPVALDTVKLAVIEDPDGLPIELLQWVEPR
ncbi:VOC family protein [Chloroflexota bacterium]